MGARVGGYDGPGGGGVARWCRNHARGNLPRSLAVLPFVNQTGTADVDSVLDGLAEGLIAELCQFPELRVMVRSAPKRFEGPGVDFEGNWPPTRRGGSAERPCSTPR